MSDHRLNHPAAWYHTPADMPDATNIMQACRLLADDVHSSVPVRSSLIVAALGAAADQIQRAEEALALAVAAARQEGAQEVLARVFPYCGGNDENQTHSYSRWVGMGPRHTPIWSCQCGRMKNATGRIPKNPKEN